MAYIYDLVDSWNSAGTTFTAIKMNVTDTASSASSLLMDLQVGGSSKFKVRKDGLATAGGLAFSLSSGLSMGPPDGATISYLISGTNYFINGTTTALSLAAPINLAWSSSSQYGYSAQDLFVGRRAAANLRLGAADAAAPVAQTLSVQSVAAGTANTAGANFTITGSQGTGTGAGGSIIFQVAPATTNGSTVNPLSTVLTIDGARTSIFNWHLYQVGGASHFGNGSYGSYQGTANFEVNQVIGFAAGTILGNAPDVFLRRDTTGILAQRNSTNAQTFRVYETFTDVSNGAWVELISTASTFKLRTNNNGTGVWRPLYLEGNGIFVGGLLTVTSFSGGACIVTKASTNTSWAATDCYNSSNAMVGGFGYGGSSTPNFSDQMFIWGSSKDIVLGIDASGTNKPLIINGSTGLVSFSGKSSAFPALKRSSTTLQARLADDSAFASVQGKLTTDTAYTAGAPTPTGYIVLYDSNGTAYKVPAQLL